MTRYSAPKEGDLIGIGAGGASLEHRDEMSLIWPDDWWDGGQPCVAISGRLGRQEARFCYEGYLAGKKAGFRDGRHEGVSGIQAGLRVLLGAASESDLNRFIRAAAEAAEEG